MPRMTTNVLHTSVEKWSASASSASLGYFAETWLSRRDFAVAVEVARVGGLIGFADGIKGKNRGEQVEKRVQSFGQHAQAAGVVREKGLQRKKDDRRADGGQRGHPLFARSDF